MNKSNFVKRTKYTKSLTFKLNPVGKTRENLEKDKVLNYDTYLREHALVVEKVMDVFYRELLTVIAKNIDIDWNNVNIDSLSDNRENILNYITAKVKSVITSNYSKLFDANFKDKQLPEWLVKNSNLIDNMDEVVESLDALKGNTAVLRKYFTSREHIFLGNGHGSFAMRVLTNYEIFLKNISFSTRLLNEQKEEIISLDDANDITCELLFDPSNYNDYISQNGIDIYNNVVGILNSEINKINNNNKEDYKKYPYLKPLYKQILTEREPLFEVEKLLSDEDCHTVISIIKEKAEKDLNKVVELITGIASDNNGVGINEKSVNSYSKYITGSPSVFKNMLLDRFIREAIDEKSMSKKKAEEYANKEYKKSILSIAVINKYIEELKKDGVLVNYNSINECMEEKLIASYMEFKRLHENFLVPSDMKENSSNVKEYFDSIKDVYSYLYTFKINGTLKDDVDADFYNLLAEVEEEKNEFNTAYNLVRNYITRKPINLAKRLSTCFGSSGLYENGWTQDNDSIFKRGNQAIFTRDNKFYYAVFSSDKNVKTQKLVLSDTRNDGDYEKLVVNALAQPSKNLPRFMISNNEIKNQFLDPKSLVAIRSNNMAEPIEITRDFFDKYNAGMHTKEYLKNNTSEKAVSEHKEFLAEYISKAIDFLTKYNPTKIFDYNFMNPEDYEDIGVFHAYVETCWYKLSKKYVSEEDINKAIEDGSLFFFEITNRYIEDGSFRDSFSQYIKYIFSEENLKNTSIKLNSRPSFFYRSAVIDENKTSKHEIGTVLVNRNTSDGKRIPEDIYRNIYKVKNGRLEERFLSDEEKIWFNKAVCKESTKRIVKDSRYTKEQFSITFSISINNNIWKRNAKTLNEIILDEYKQDRKILSIVRGQRNLLYCVLMDKDEKILMQKSFNIVHGTDYHDKLTSYTRDKKESQRNWEVQKTIKGLKEGYLSAAISEIIKIALENNALIAIESLSDSFKGERAEVDNQVFKTFETALKNRLACYYTSSTEVGQPGSSINPLSLTNDEFDGIFNGILLSIEPSYISNMCPVTGFVPLFDYEKLTTVALIRDFFESFKSISYNKNTLSFEFEFDYRNFKTKKDVKNNTKWTLTSLSSKTRWNAQNKQYEVINVTDEIKGILKKNKISFENGENIVNDIENINAQGIDKLLRLFKMICSMVVYGNEGMEYYVSPVKTENGIAYDSRDVLDNSLPNCKDSVKAYLLGLKAFRNMDKAEKGEKLGIKAEEWVLNI